MITKNDCLTILVSLQDKGIEVDEYITQLMLSNDLPIDVLKFIAANRGVEAINFYEMLRKSYNKKKSPLYGNIVKQVNSFADILTTLACLQTQIVLYGNKLQNQLDRFAFYRQVRAEELARVLSEYFVNGEQQKCRALHKLVKADLTVLEYIAGRRQLE